MNDILAEVIARESRIDILKVDTEGLEEATVASIRPELLEHVQAIYLECETPVVLHADCFSNRYANMTLQLTRPVAARTSGRSML